MAAPITDRQVVRRARRRLDEWLYDARSRAFDDLFSGEDARLSGEELAALDRIDSTMNRQGRDGIWGTDQYGILPGAAVGDDGGPRVIPVYHPEIPDDFAHLGDRETGAFDDATEERLNDALWDYAERVAVYAQEDLDAFVEGEG